MCANAYTNMHVYAHTYTVCTHMPAHMYSIFELQIKVGTHVTSSWIVACKLPCPLPHAPSIADRQPQATGAGQPAHLVTVWGSSQWPIRIKPGDRSVTWDRPALAAIPSLLYKSLSHKLTFDWQCCSESLCEENLPQYYPWHRPPRDGCTVF